MMGETNAEALIAQLRNFRTRSVAGDALVAMGPAAVQPLLDALEAESSEGARWAMLKCLGEIGAAEAVPALVRYLEDDDYQTVAHEALIRIARRDAGPLAADWLRWLEEQQAGAEQGSSAPSPGGATRESLTDAGLLELALQHSRTEWREESPGRYAVSVPLKSGASSSVTVAFGGNDHEGAEIVVVYSVCGKARPEQYETVLRENLRMPYGAVALREAGGELHFVTFNTILRKDLSPVELRKSIMAVGQSSERVRNRL